jgi:hypothetical protein
VFRNVITRAETYSYEKGLEQKLSTYKHMSGTIQKTLKTELERTDGLDFLR